MSHHDTSDKSDSVWTLLGIFSSLDCGSETGRPRLALTGEGGDTSVVLPGFPFLYFTCH